MNLEEIYQPIRKELKLTGQALKKRLEASGNKAISRISGYLLARPGKKLRPALTIFCAKAASGRPASFKAGRIIEIASGIELIHLASLIHDDVLDHAVLRHNMPSVNSRWGTDASIVLGDYLYSCAFESIAAYGCLDIFSCISKAARLMCEGELIQICERNNLDLLRERYFLIVKKKTASLFAASCRSGAIIAECPAQVRNALEQYGLNFGIAFQIADDCLDLISEEKELGKSPGADFKMGEATLPLLNLLSGNKDKNKVISLLKNKNRPEAFSGLKEIFITSRAFLKTKEEVAFYIKKAKKSLTVLQDSFFKKGLLDLTDYLADKLERGNK